MSKRLFVTPYRCTDCKNCEVACSFVHTTNAQKPALSRIRAYSLKNAVKTVVVCLQCEEAACVTVCPVDALVRNPETGAIERNDNCIKCKMCTVTCPFGNIHFDLTNSEIVKCDVCQGDPACAKVCPTRALVWADEPLPDLGDGEEIEVTPLPWVLAMPKK